MSGFYTNMRDGTATRLLTKYGTLMQFRRNYPKVANPVLGTTVSTVCKSGTTIAAVPDGFTDSANEFITKGFLTGQCITVTGFASAGLNSTYTIASVTANKITTVIAPNSTETALNAVSIEANYIIYNCQGVQEAYRDKDINGTTIRTGDQKIILTATYTDSLGTKQTLPIAPAPKDIIIVNSDVWQVINNEHLAPGGTAILYTLQARL